ncbi:hypothetical protein GALL_341360 [mine drainage metagenome]|uniref:Uncharacterized protein n=1 Tax=mine drainage metagenome TaxID=410659 RepID=A0A1J5QKS5_9ZZZZ
MALPIPSYNSISGNGDQNFKAVVMGWIREEIGRAAQGGANGALHIDGATKNLIIDQGEIQSGNYVTGSAGWALQPDGNAEFNVLTLRSGIIGPDALTNPADFGASGTSETGFGLTSTPTNRAASTIAVPAGYTRAEVHVTVDATAINTALSGLLIVSASINGITGGENSGGPVPNSYYANASASAIRTLTGLSGGNITVATAVHCDAGTWPANANNIANCNASVVFLR